MTKTCSYCGVTGWVPDDAPGLGPELWLVNTDRYVCGEACERRVNNVRKQAGGWPILFLPTLEISTASVTFPEAPSAPRRRP